MYPLLIRRFIIFGVILSFFISSCSFDPKLDPLQIVGLDGTANFATLEPAPAPAATPTIDEMTSEDVLTRCINPASGTANDFRGDVNVGSCRLQNSDKHYVWNSSGKVILEMAMILRFFNFNLRL